MDKKYLVTQSNNLIEARHINPLTAREQKIILTMVSLVQPADEDFKDYRISIREFHEMLGLEGREKYSEIKAITKELMTKSVEIPKSDGGWILANWVSSAEYLKGEGAIALSFSPKLIPYLLQLKSAFTSYQLSNILSLKSTYSIRLYELLKKWEYLGRWEQTVDELKLKLGIQPGKYKQYGHFKSKVLKQAVDEINEKTDLLISFLEIRKGRKIEKVNFSIRSSTSEKKQIVLAEELTVSGLENEDVRERLNALSEGYQFDRTYFNQMYQSALLIWSEAAERELEILIRYINEDSSVKNPLGLIKVKLKTAWNEYSQGIPVTFETLQQTVNHSNGQREIIPEWFKQTQLDSYSTQISNPDPDIEARRKILLEELNQINVEKDDV